MWYYLLLVDTFRFLDSIEYVFVNASEALTGRTAAEVLLYVTTNCISFKIENENKTMNKKTTNKRKRSRKNVSDHWQFANR